MCNIISLLGQASDQPPEPDSYRHPVMFLWNKHPIILEHYSSNIWILDGSNWKNMEATFNGYEDTATTVPRGIFTC